MSSNHSKQTAWKIVYSDFSGMERKAVELLNREAGKNIIRDTGVYTLYVLPMEQESKNTEIAHSAFVVGLWENSDLVRKFVSKNEIPDNGYCLKIIHNPKREDGSIVIVTAHEARNLFYGATAFLDEYVPHYAPDGGGLKFSNSIFEYQLPTATYASAPQTQTRSVFSWGHCINDYREYIRDMARLGLNQLILWNDFKPINAKDIVDYAHEYGVELIWGFSWGWSTGQCRDTTTLTDEYLSALKLKVLDKFEKEYAGQG
ncbi:MAG: hypothetical protein IJ393_02465, partial [Clostridia bacterium]|nr:hypothetical protein [Clostridia bacterium]